MSRRITAPRSRAPKRVIAGLDVILASASPRRRLLLKRLVPAFRTLATDVDEDRFRSDDPVHSALRAAKAKARTAGRLHPGSLIIAADTLVSLGRRIFGKPGSHEEARDMLRGLSGRRHRVVTAVVLYRDEPRRMLTGSETSWVTFRRLSTDDIDSYLDAVEYRDKAGAYAIQEFGDRLVARLEGDYDNVVGFPSGLVKRLLEAWARRRRPSQPAPAKRR